MEGQVHKDQCMDKAGLQEKRVSAPHTIYSRPSGNSSARAPTAAPTLKLKAKPGHPRRSGGTRLTSALVSAGQASCGRCSHTLTLPGLPSGNRALILFISLLMANARQQLFQG